MTEFVIGLPIFIIIFSGFGSLYQTGTARLVTIGTSNAELWNNAQNDPPAESFTPLGNLAGIDNGGWGDAAISVADASGTYGESYAKTLLASYIPGSATDPKYKVADITELKDESPTNILLNDQPFNTNGVGFNSVTSALNSLLSLAGGRLAIGAGIRYGKERSTATDTSVSTIFGTYTSTGVSLVVPRNTAATHRLLPVTLVRLAVADNEALDGAIVEFVMDDINTDGKPDWADDDSQPVDDPSVEIECASEEEQADQQENYEDCLDDEIPSGDGPYTAAETTAAQEYCSENTSC